MRSGSGQRRAWCARLALAAWAVAGAAPAGALAPSARIEGGAPELRFGDAVASAGDVNGDGYEDVIVGAPFFEDGEASEGAAFVFHGGPNGLGNGSAAGAATVLQGDQDDARFGVAVASAGDVDADGYDDVVVGSGGWDGGQTDEGAAFVFLGGPFGVASGGTATADATLQGDAANARLGSAVAGAGDVDGDGYDDVVAGGRLYQSQGDQSNEGVALIFRGGPNGVASGGFATAHARLQSDVAGAFFGDAVAGAGDVNGDGYDDVLVGATRFSGPEVREGAAFLFQGSAAGIADGGPATAAARLESDQVDAWFGASVAAAGDVNGDGYADIAVGAPQWDGGAANEGAAFVWLGGPAGIASGSASSAAARLEGDQVDQTQPGGGVRGVQLGSALAGGDANADGYDDVLAGAPYYDAGQVDEGAAFLFRGGPGAIASGGAASAARRLEADRAGNWLATAVGFADANGDGFADALVAALRFGDPFPAEQSEGALYVFPGAPNAACENGADDDGDAQVDLADPGCSAAEDRFEEIDVATGATTTLASAQAESVVVHDGPLSAPTTAVLAAGGAVNGSLRAIERSRVRVEGGAVAGAVVAADAARAEIAGGSVAAVAARGAAVIEIRGSGFDHPLGELGALAGDVAGTLADGTPFAASFERDAGATIRLAPEPAATALSLASLGALAAAARADRRGRARELAARPKPPLPFPA
ncbi:MAG: hypothetical protein DCC71_04965 [Proteobacteria bacterium]|nr:MAG: hypothetical protein DCC71_04965 [Pseudomonadota bacterium]